MTTSEIPLMLDIATAREVRGVIESLSKDEQQGIYGDGARMVYDACIAWLGGDSAAFEPLGLHGIQDPHQCFLVLRLAHQYLSDSNSILRQHRTDYEAGKRPALAMAIAVCDRMQWEWPEWVQVAVRGVLVQALSPNADVDIRSQLFGPQTARKQHDAILAEALLQCYEQLQRLKRQGELWGPDGSKANTKRVLAEFLGVYRNDPETPSESTIGKHLDAAKLARSRKSAPTFTAAGYHLSLLRFLADKGYWTAKRSN